jgi:ribosome-associated protein
VTPQLALREEELEESFIRASGPGGQNVNKVASAVQLRFDARRSASLPDRLREPLLRLAGGKATREGVIVIEAGRFREQHRNREDARERLAELIRRAAQTPKPRRPSRPTAAARYRRLDDKKHRASLKQLRRRESGE